VGPAVRIRVVAAPEGLLMDIVWKYCGNLYPLLDPHWAGVVLIFCSVVCGAAVGAEREFKHKSAGLRTLTLICVGSCMFTMASVLIAGDVINADRTRVAAQVVSGIGFLGAGAIIRERGTVLGLTTAATIWAVAAIGVMVGGGYAVAGLVLTFLVVGTLTVVQRFQRFLIGPCRFSRCLITYDPRDGKTRIRLLRVLDEFQIPDRRWKVVTLPDGRQNMEIWYCHFHSAHRAFLTDLVEVSGVQEIEHALAPRKTDED